MSIKIDVSKANLNTSLEEDETMEDYYDAERSLSEHMYALVGNKTETETTDANATIENTNTTENTTSNTNTEAKTNKPKTGDNIIIVFCVFVISLLGVLITIKLNRNKNVKKL